MREYRLHDGRKVKARRRLQKPNARMRRLVGGKLWLKSRGRRTNGDIPYLSSTVSRDHIHVLGLER
jgi:hypothetical protein